MLHSRAPFRIAAHRLPGPRKHGDLFVDLPGREGLLTFELDAMLLEMLVPQFRRAYLVLSDRSLEPLIRRNFSVLDAPSAVFGGPAASDLMKIPLRKKPDHRKMYMTYSGKVETRGVLEDFARGKLDGFAFNGENYLVIER